MYKFKRGKKKVIQASKPDHPPLQNASPDPQGRNPPRTPSSSGVSRKIYLIIGRKKNVDRNPSTDNFVHKSALSDFALIVGAAGLNTVGLICARNHVAAGIKCN